MTRTFSELAERYADMHAARAAWFLPAANVPQALAKLGLIAPTDRLVACSGDDEAALRASFRSEVLRFVEGLTPEAFTATSVPDAAPAATTLPDGTAAQARISYAHAAGACVDRLFWLVSSIGARGLVVPDLRALAQAAQASGAILIVDNTLATSFGCQPLGQGAHIVLEELDVAVEGGFSRPLVGMAVAPSVTGNGRRRRTDPVAEEAYLLLAMRLGQGVTGFISEGDLAALDAGMEALASHMQRRMDSARAIAEYLSCHPQVAHVWYPGLSSHADHKVATATLRHGFGPVVEFELSCPVSAAPVVSFCTSALEGESAGGIKTRFSVVPEGSPSRLARIHVGTDEPLAIADSLDQALRMFCNPPQP